MDRGERTLRAEELAGDVQGLASHNDDLLAVEQLLGDRGGQATEEVALAVDDLSKVLAGVVSPVRKHRWRSVGFLVCARRGNLTITGSNVDMAMICLDLLVSEEESGG
jgi:hypothetical protein